MTYPEPKPALTNLRLDKNSGDTVRLIDDSKLTLEVEQISSIGWSFELRYDLSNSNTWRQPFTGAQSTLSRDKIIAKDGKETIELAGGDECRR